MLATNSPFNAFKTCAMGKPAQGISPALLATQGLGVNIHFSDPLMADVRMIQGAGFKHVRMDFLWEKIETAPGVYNFAVYDGLIKALLQHGITPLVILGGNHRLYAKSPTDAGFQGITSAKDREAFTRFATAAVKHYAGLGLQYELWNEPNHPQFWKPKPDVHQYMQLAKMVLPALRQADPTAKFIGPGASGVPLPFIEQCLKEGLLPLVDGISVHPYQAYNPGPNPNRAPEMMATELQELRDLLARYAKLSDPNKASMPILFSEWGYSTALGEQLSPQTQGAYCARSALLSMAEKLPLNIWYDWKEDGTDPANKEHHFGTVSPTLQPKPAYYAMQQLTQQLQGLRYVKRLPLPNPNDYVLVFNGPDPLQSGHVKTVLAVWTASDQPHTIPIAGQSKPLLLTGMPQYVRT
jgi:polysaccharide biosynthesis protein PslG